MKKKISFIVSIVLIAMLTLSGCGGGGQQQQQGSNDGQKQQAEKIVIRFANSSSTGDAVTEGVHRFKDLVEERSNGAIEIQVHDNGVLGNDRDTTEQMQAGSLEMVASSSANASAFIPELLALDLPYITRPENDLKLYESFDNGDLGNYYNGLAEAKGMKVLTWFEYGYRNFVSSKAPITCLADMKGLKVRTTASLVEQDVVTALNGMPMQVNWNDTYTAMQQGTVDLEGNTFVILCAAKHNEVIKYAIDSAHNYNAMPIMMNLAYWNGLSEENQQLLMDCAHEAAVWQRELSDELAETSKQQMIDEGIQVHELTDAERQEFIDATAGVWDNFPDQIPQEAIDLILATQE